MRHRAPADELLLRVEKLGSESQLDEAAAVLSEAMRDGLDGPVIIHRLALVEAQRGRWVEAERLARDAVMTGGDQYARALAQILTQLGRHAEALDWFRRALAFNPRDVWAHAGLAKLYRDGRKLDEALACFDQALAIQPDLSWALGARQELISEISFLRTARKAFDVFVRGKGLDPSTIDESRAIEIPSAFKDAGGRPRFTMAIAASDIANDLGAAHLFFREVGSHGYEFALRRFLDAHLMSDDVFIDVGAHWGIHSLTAASRLPGEVSVLAIEAHPDNSARIGDWVQRNRFGANIEVIQKAIGDHDGLARLWVNGSTMGHSMRTDGVAVGPTAIEVEMTTLDRLLADRAHLRWRRIIIKIDVEGCEMDVLAGAQRLFSAEEVAAVIWEKAAFHEPAVQDRLDAKILDFLGSHGFEHFRMEDEGTGGRLVPLEGKHAICNVYSLGQSLRALERL